MILKRSSAAVLTLALCSALVLFNGCNKSSSGVAADVALPGSMLNADGTINDNGLKEIEAHSKDPILHITIVRAPLSDAGLAQLARFPNIRRVDAVGSRITDQGIAKLKESLPQVEVAK